MKNIIIGDIKIEYDNNSIDKIDYIEKIIKNNYNLFLNALPTSKTISLIPNKGDNITYISNFDIFFDDIVNKFYNNEETKNAFINKETIIALFVGYLIKHSENTLCELDNNIGDEQLESLLAYGYFLQVGSFQDFIDFLKNRKDFDKIIEYFKKNLRYQTYNYLLEVTVNRLKELDFNLLKSISNIVDKMIENIAQNFKMQDVNQNLPMISIEELDKLFIEFLNSVKAPIEWINMYENLKRERKIIFKKCENIHLSKCYRKNEDLKILITTDGSICAFYSLVHEFAHYVSMKNFKSDTTSPIAELPSIFFEKLALEFLKNKGYSQEIINTILKIRNENNTEICLNLSSLFIDLSRYINGGEITREAKIKYQEENQKCIHEFKTNFIKMCEENKIPIPDQFFLEDKELDIPKLVDEETDDLIKDFIQNGILILDGYQYLLDTFLAEEILKRRENDTDIISKMFKITNELKNISLKDIITIFSMEDLFNETKDKEKIYKKSN